MRRRKIVTILGTRPEDIEMAPVIGEIAATRSQSEEEGRSLQKNSSREII